jgi:hypothetical protein
VRITGDRVRLRYLAQRLHALWPRPLFHYLDEVERGHDLRGHLEKYAHLDPDFVAAAGARLRSRLEARWAAFFDLVGWSWDYEPCDFDGWTPDFALYGFVRESDALSRKTIYVEVKPIDWNLDEGFYNSEGGKRS